ncbi:MAG: Hsp20/alpha crystallin family protein [Bacteroidia bacterium]|nr:Hsp20/alpha crystallin family protein [Bacteroidia bacterium]|tara:strand:- start:10114 stop:10536 length:423 start_codon:yes stop_codon:yes gene_type:complete
MNIRQPKMITDIFQSNFDNVLQEILNPQSIQDNEVNLPKMNIYEDENSYLIKTVIPGVDKKDISLSLDNNTLVIFGTTSQENNEKLTRLRSEISFKDFKRRISLPKDSDRQSISANLINGILEIVIKKKQKIKPKNIIVK